MPEVNTVAAIAATAAPTIPLWLEFLRAIAPVIAALIAGFVAWRFGLKQTANSEQQAKTAKDKLRLDLFEKRLTVYEAAKNFLHTACTIGDVSPKDEIDYMAGVSAAGWLFDEEIYKYLANDLWNLTTDLHQKNQELQGLINQETRKNLADERNLVFKKIVSQNQVLRDLMKPYLHFTD